MNSRAGRTRLLSSMLGLLLAGGALAASFAGGVSPAPIAVQPIALDPGARIPGPPNAEASLALIRDQVYSSAKNLGVAPEVLGPALERIAEQAAYGQVDMASVNDVTATIEDYDIAMKVEGFLLGYAETAALGTVVDGHLPVEGLDEAKSITKEARLGGRDPLSGRRDPPSGGLDPLNGGTCLTCPSFDFGPFIPTPAWQFHAESTDTNVDCNIYQFNVTVGLTYEFSFCGPDGGAAGFDTVLELYNAGTCVQLTSNDDSCGSASKISWLANTGTVNLRVRGFSGSGSPPWAFGGYTLAYRQVPCTTCAAPNPTTLFPTNACQIVSGNVNSLCPTLFYTVSLNAGGTYEFSTCPLHCAGSSCTTVSDTVLELYVPGSAACTSVMGDRVAINDDSVPSCTGTSLRSRISYIAPVSGLYKIKARAFLPATSGTICMSYRETAPGCPNNCGTGPFVATLSPNSTCQVTTSTITLPCTDAWYLVNVPIAGIHEFTTCAGPPCAGGFVAGIDSAIELYNNACGFIASDDDGCGPPRSRLTVNIVTPGTYKLRVRSITNTGGSFGLTYRTVGILCVPPSAVAVSPASGVASSGINTCTINQAFNVTSAGTSSPMNYAWTIGAPAGGSAVPNNGAAVGAVGPTNPASFNSTLTGEGVYVVNVTATNACNSAMGSVNYQLVDTTAPVFTTFPADAVVECDAVPPAPVLSASDNCDPNPVETFAEVITPGACVGRYVITRTWSARDRSGNVSAPRTQTVTVVDTTPPSVTTDTSYKFCIWPPNHELVCFTKDQFAPVISENCSEPVTWRFVGVLNSEEGYRPCGDGNVDPDVIVAPDGSGFCVRSERCGQDPAMNDGRIYLVFGTATDACGNTSAPTAMGAILVPHDQSDTSSCIYPQ